MTREEKALEASKRFAGSLTGSDLVSLSRDDMCFAFQLGIKWADSNPKSLWISVDDDLPCNHDSLLIRCLPYNNTLTKPVLTLVDDGSYQVCEMFINGEGKWEWSYNGTVICWSPIPELPKDKKIVDKTMERKIGETFEYEGKKLQVKAASNDKCEGCIFNGKCTHFTKEFTGICGRRFREDKKNIIIVEVTDDQSQEQAELFEKAKCDYVSYKRSIQRLEENYPSLKYLDCSKYLD